MALSMSPTCLHSRMAGRARRGGVDWRSKARQHSDSIAVSSSFPPRPCGSKPAFTSGWTLERQGVFPGMASQVIWSQEAHFSPDHTSAAKARVFVGTHLKAHELTYMSDDVELVVSELVTNVLVHAHTAVSVTLEELLFCVRLTVHNGSSSPAMVKTRVTSQGGRGLLIVDRCSEDWGVDTAANGDKSVWALFEVQPPPFEPRDTTDASSRSVPQRPHGEDRHLAHIPPQASSPNIEHMGL